MKQTIRLLIMLLLLPAYWTDRVTAQSARNSSPSAAHVVRPKPSASDRTKPAPISSIPLLQKAITDIIEQPKFATTRWGILIESLDRKRVLFSRHATHLFVPASNLKLYTTAAALVHLGPSYRFRTSVYSASSPDSRGIITGDVILYGRGDPNLSSRAGLGGTLTPLDHLAEQLHRAGLREIRGDIVGDESYFTGPPLGVAWEWDDLQWSYGSEVSALSVDDNSIALTILPGQAPGQPARIFVSPESAYVTVINQAVTTAADAPQQIHIRRGLEDNRLEIWGTIPTGSEGYRGYIAVHKPALYAATLFAESLARRGIKLTGRIRHADARLRRHDPLNLSTLKELAFVESIPLAEELRIVNKISQNLHTELLLRTLGAVVAQDGTAEKGISLIQQLLKTANARRQGIVLTDGSGLSRHNLVTPATTVDLLRYMYQQPQREVYIESLPIASIDGTLEHRMRGTPAQENVRAKTGTLRYTSTLSGYVTTARGERLVFSIMANEHTGPIGEVTAAANEICALLARFSGSP